MNELRNIQRHLLAGGVTALVLAVVGTVVPSVVEAVDSELERHAPDFTGLVRVALVALVAAAVYTAVVVCPTVSLLSRVAGARWVLVVGPALVLSGVVDLVLLSRGYWVPDATLAHWPLWVAGLAFGPAVYIYWSVLRTLQGVAHSANV